MSLGRDGNSSDSFLVVKEPVMWLSRQDFYEIRV